MLPGHEHNVEHYCEHHADPADCPDALVGRFGADHGIRVHGGSSVRQHSVLSVVWEQPDASDPVGRLGKLEPTTIPNASRTKSAMPTRGATQPAPAGTTNRIECRGMTRDYVLWNLREAAEELSKTIESLRTDSDYGDSELAVAMSHLYHHLNTAWNARNATRLQVEKCSAEDFLAWRQFPPDVDMTLV